MICVHECEQASERAERECWMHSVVYLYLKIRQKEKRGATTTRLLAKRLHLKWWWWWFLYAWTRWIRVVTTTSVNDAVVVVLVVVVVVFVVAVVNVIDVVCDELHILNVYPFQSAASGYGTDRIETVRCCWMRSICNQVQACACVHVLLCVIYVCLYIAISTWWLRFFEH